MIGLGWRTDPVADARASGADKDELALWVRYCRSRPWLPLRDCADRLIVLLRSRGTLRSQPEQFAKLRNFALASDIESVIGVLEQVVRELRKEPTE